MPHQMLMEKCAVKMWAMATPDNLRTNGFCRHLPAGKSFLPVATAEKLYKMLFETYKVAFVHFHLKPKSGGKWH